MALISCPDCKSEVSDRAPACPRCGAPIATAADASTVGVPLQTIQGTAKALKAQIAWCAVGFWGAFIGFWLVGDGPESTTTRNYLGALMMASMIWYLITKIRVWWHHS